MEIICAHTETGISATKAQRYYAQRVPHHLGALSRPRRPVGPMRDGSGTGAPEPRALTVADTPQTAPTTPSAPRQTDAEGAAPLAAGPWCPRPNAPPKAGEASPHIPFLGCYPGWRQARSLRWRRRAPPKAAQTEVSPERTPAPIHEASLPTPKASLSSPRMQPTACLDPRSARRRAKRGARRGARTAHQL